MYSNLFRKNYNEILMDDLLDLATFSKTFKEVLDEGSVLDSATYFAKMGMKDAVNSDELQQVWSDFASDEAFETYLNGYAFGLILKEELF